MLHVPIVLCVHVCVCLGRLSEGRVFRVSLSDGIGRADHSAGPHRLQEHPLRVSVNIMLLKKWGGV